MRLILKLISSTSRVPQKLLKYFNGTAISTSLILPTAGILPLILALDLNDSESGITACDSSL